MKHRIMQPLILALLAMTFTQGAASAGGTNTGSVQLEGALGSSYILAGSPRTAYLRVALKGQQLPSDVRTPVNLSIVLDRSGSMQGEKLEQAKKAAIMAIERLQEGDYVSVVAYDSRVQVLAASAPLESAERVIERIRSLTAGTNTALFAGVSKGAFEVRKALSPNRVNRVILLSDGLANEGPSSPEELAELGQSLGRDGIVVSTIGLGLGYNEELMGRLAQASDGNHFFAERAADLAGIYSLELGDVLSVVAQDVNVSVKFASGTRPVRILGRSAEIQEDHVEATLNQLYSGQTKYLLMEVEVNPGHRGEERLMATVEARYQDTIGRERGGGIQQVRVAFTDSPQVVESNRDVRVMSSVARQIGAERNRLAMRMRDQGKIAEAKKLLRENSSYLEEKGRLYSNSYLIADAEENAADLDNLDTEDWIKQRKVMTKNQLEAVQSLGYVE